MIAGKVGSLDHHVYTKVKLKTFHIYMLKLYVERSENQLVKNDALAEASVAIIDIQQTEGSDNDSFNENINI